MRHQLVLSMLVVTLSYTACDNPPAEPNGSPQGTVQEARFDEIFDLRVGRAAHIGGNALTLAFRRVDGDSRCPMDAVCVWMGDALARVEVAVGKAAWTPIELHTHLDPKQATVGDYSIELVALLPYPRSDQTINPDEYVAQLRVSRN